MVIEGSGYLPKREPRKVKVESQGYRLRRILRLLEKPLSELLTAVSALEDLFPVCVPIPHHSDRTAWALNRVLCEDLRLRVVLKLDPRGNPELGRVDVLAQANLFVPLLEVQTITDILAVNQPNEIYHLAHGLARVL